MKKKADIQAAILAGLEESKLRQEQNPLVRKTYGAEQSLADLYDALKARLPKAMEAGDHRAIGQAFHDAMLTAIVAKKTREEFGWKPHAMRAAEKIKRDLKAEKAPPLSTEKLSTLVAEQLKKQGILARGDKPLTPDTIKRELLRANGFKII